MNWSLKRKMLGLFLASMGLSALGFGVGLISSKQVSSSYIEHIGSMKYERSNSEALAESLERLRYEELNYFSSRQATSKKAIEDALKSITTLANSHENKDSTIRSKFEDLHNQALKLEKAIQLEFKLFDQEGTTDTELLGSLRRHAHSIESKIKSSVTFNRDKAQISYLNLRRHEKDYLARRDSKYLKKIGEEKERFFKILGPRGLKAKGNANLVNDYNNYLQTFTKLEQNYRELLSAREATSKTLSEFEKSRAEVYQIINDRIVEIEKKADQSLSTMHLTLYASLFLLLLVIAFAANYIRNTSNELQQISKVIANANTINQKLSLNLSHDSSKLSESVTEQAASLEETSSTLTEIESMVHKSQSHAEQSSEKSLTSESLARVSQESLKELNHSLMNLAQSSEKLEKDIQKSNARYAGIVNIIRQIIEKTQVINDIVVQSRLLSFNASVEAARAGEQGKGFAVVATEVGQLANLSGTAAKEISQLLATSKTDVESVVQESETMLREMSNAIKTQVESGIAIASRCQVQIEQVYTHSQTVRKSMDEIRSATKEQAEGVGNINKALHGIEAAVTDSANLAENSATAADDLNQQAKKLSSAVQKLELMLTGRQYPMASVHRFPRRGTNKSEDTQADSTKQSA